MLLVGLALLSWQDRPGRPFPPEITDTVPNSAPRNLDEVLLQLDKIDIDKEFRRAQAEFERAFREVDANKIRLEFEKAMAQSNVEKMEKEWKESLSRMDFNKLKKELGEHLSETELSKMQAEFNEAMKKVDLEKMKVEMEKMKSENMKEMEQQLERAGRELREIKPKMEADLKKAKHDIEKAKQEIREYKAFTESLEKDGLISRDKGFTLDYREGKLLINGSPAPSSVYTQYASFLEKHTAFRLVQGESGVKLERK